MTGRRLFISTGDPSGDIHAAAVINALQSLEPSIEISGICGPEMEKTGIHALATHRHMGQVGFGAIASAPYHAYLGLQTCHYLQYFQPEAVLLIDYGGYHLRLAKALKARGHKVFYYIPPQVWASRASRLKTIAKTVDHVFCIFPFEEALYQAQGIPVTYVGHPLAHQLPPPTPKVQFCKTYNLQTHRPLVGILPGSRKMEIKYLLPELISALPKLQQLIVSEQQYPAQFVLAESTALDPQWMDQQIAKASQNVDLSKCPLLRVRGNTHAVLSAADMGLVASGTATLEAAYYQLPMVITYKGPALVYEIVKRVLKLPCVGLPNILTNMSHYDIESAIAPELIQNLATADHLAQWGWKMLNPQSSYRKRALEGLASIKAKLNTPEPSATLVAEGILKYLDH